MENVSDALVMAGTILISLIVISVLVLMFSGVIRFNKNEEGITESQQIAEFNKQYTSFEKNLYGNELLSLINKAVDYNTKNTADGFTPITISFKIKTGTGNDNNKSLVKSGQTYSIPAENNTPDISNKLLVVMEKIKETYKGDQYLQRLVLLYNSVENASNETEKENKKNELENLLQKIDKTYTIDNTKNDIMQYSEYIEFKRKKFRFIKTISDGEIQTGSTKKDTKGRIVKMSFEEM